MKRRMMSLLLVAAMLLGMLSTAAAAPITVYVTVSEKGVLAADKYGEAMGYRAVTVTDRDSDGKLTVFDAYDCAHEQYCAEAFAANGSGYVGALWGDVSGAFLTFIDGVGLMGTLAQTEIAANSHLVGVILKDSSYWSDYYSEFDISEKTVRVGEDVTLTLSGVSGMFGGSMGPLEGIAVGTWENGAFVSSNVTTDASGQATLRFDAAGTYTVTASGDAMGVSPISAPACRLTVTAPYSPAEAAAIVGADIAALDVTYDGGSSIALPRVGASGETGISWASDSAVIDAQTGAVTKAATAETVHLTATVTLGEASDTKLFPIAVPAITASERLSAVAAALENLTAVEYANPSEYSGCYAYDSPAKDTSVLALAQSVAAAVDAEVSVALGAGASDEIVYGAAETSVSVPLVLCLGSDTLDCTANLAIPAHTQNKSEAIAAMKQEVRSAMSNSKVLGTNASIDAVKTALTLPGGKSSGLYITWESSDAAVALKSTKPSSSSSFPTKGKYDTAVTRPDVGETDKTVTLTAIFRYNETTGMCAPGPMPADNTLTVDVKVLAVTESEMRSIVDAAAGDIRLGSKSGAVADLAAVTENLYLPNYEGFTAAWSEESGAIAVPATGYGTATVTRPTDGENKTVTLTLALTKGAVSKSANIPVTLAPWSETELSAKRADLQAIADALSFNTIKKSNTAADNVTGKLDMKQNARVSGDSVSFSTYNSSSYPYTIAWTITPDDGTLTYSNGTGTVAQKATARDLTLTASIDLKQPIATVSPVTKEISITVPGLHTPTEAGTLEAQLNSIAATLTETANWESFLAMSAYEDALAGAKLSSAAKQNMVNTAVSNLLGEKGESSYATAILTMQSIGIDPAMLYAVNGNTPLSAVTKLGSVQHDSSIWTAAYTLLAFRQGAYAEGTQETEIVASLLSQQQSDGRWESWGTTADCTGLAILALSKYYGSDAAVTAALDKAVAYLSSIQLTSGGYGGTWGENANNAACVIMGLCALGIDPDSDERFIKGGVSLLDALLAYATAGGFAQSVGGTAVDPYATQQGFPALLAAYSVKKNAEKYCVYDFSHNTDLAPARAAGAGSSQRPSAPTGGNITVTMTVKADNSYWMADKAVTLPGEGATVYHVLIEGIKGSGITLDGLDEAYVKSMSCGGRTLGEFDQGANSGWMYKLNGAVPNEGMTTCAVADGDALVWFYTVDWTHVPGAGGAVGGAAEKDEETESESVSFNDVSASDYYYGAVLWAAENGVTTGTSEGVFSPDEPCTRGETVTFLYRAAKASASAGELPFADVAESDFFYDAVSWAVSAGITAGTAADAFSPKRVCTRAEMAMFLYRAYGEKADAEVSFTDVSEGDYYYDAVSWAVSAGVTRGTGDGQFSPDKPCTRAEMVTFLHRCAKGAGK